MPKNEHGAGGAGGDAGVTPNKKIYLLANGVFSPDKTKYVCLEDGTTLDVAAELGLLEEVNQLLKKRADVDAVSSMTKGTPLWCAAKEGHINVVKILLKEGANIEARSHDGTTPLLCAAKKGHLAVVKVLLGAGANIEVFGQNGATALYQAAKYGKRTVVEELIKRGANLEGSRLVVGWGTPLIVAAKYDQREVVELLLTAGANFYALHFNKFNALEVARQYRSDDTVYALAEFQKQQPSAVCIML